MLRHIPNAEVVTLQRDGTTVTLTTGGTRVTLFSADAGDFPPLPNIQGEGELVDGDRVVKALLAGVPYCATGTAAAARPVLGCVCVTLGDPIAVAGGDGYWLAWQDIPLKLTGEGSGLKQLLAPRESVQALEQVWRRAVKPPVADQGTVKSNFPKPNTRPSLEAARMAVARRMMRVRIQSGQASFQFGEASLQTQLLTGEFPNYQGLIPEDLPKKVTFDAEAAYRVVRMLAPMSAGKTGPGIIRMEWEGQTMQLSARSEEQGEVSGALSVTSQGDPGQIAFNVRYLLEYLAGKYGLVLMESSVPSSPARSTHAGNPNLVLMPMSVADNTPAAAPAPAQGAAPEAPQAEAAAGPEEPSPATAEAAPLATSSPTRRGRARSPRP